MSRRDSQNGLSLAIVAARVVAIRHRRYPLNADPDRSTTINLAESINFSPFQKIRTLFTSHR